MLVVDGKRIIRMTAEGIAYLDEDTFEQFIYFSDCYENELNRRTTADYWEKIKELNHWDDSRWDKYLESLKRSKMVATRNIIDLYIEFYSETRIQFTFETEEEWSKLRNHIEDVGWNTFDIT